MPLFSFAASLRFAIRALLRMIEAVLALTQGRAVPSVMMNVAFAKPSPEGHFYRYCYVSSSGMREKALQPGEWLDDAIVPGSVRCDRLESAPTPVRDARLRTSRASLRTEGFELRRHLEPLSVPDFLQRESFEAWLSEELLPKTASLLWSAMEESYGHVAAVHVIDYTLRTTDGSGIDPRNVVKEAHADFTPESGAKRLQSERIVFKLGEGDRPIKIEDCPLLVNVWQPLVHKVVRVPLAVCDVRSLSSGDLVRKTMYFEHRTGEVFNVKRNESQKWWYYKHMRMDEALIFITWSPDGKTTPHSAVEDPTDPDDAPPRRSMEIRFAVKCT